MRNLICGAVLLSCCVSSQGLAAPILDDSANADMLVMKARFLNGHQPTTQAPGHRQHELVNRRGGPHAAHFKQAGCGGIAIGNVNPVFGDHRQHDTQVIIHGHIYNSGNRC